MTVRQMTTKNSVVCSSGALEGIEAVLSCLLPTALLCGQLSSVPGAQLGDPFFLESAHYVVWISRSEGSPLYEKENSSCAHKLLADLRTKIPFRVLSSFLTLCAGRPVGSDLKPRTTNACLSGCSSAEQPSPALTP